MSKTYDFIRKYIFWIIILIIGLIYILTGLTNIKPSEENTFKIICEGALATILGWLINALMGQNGIEYGLVSNDLISAINEMASEYDQIETEINKLDIYCEYKNNALLERRQKKWCKYARVEYDDFLKGNFVIPSIFKIFNLKERKKIIGLTKAEKSKPGNLSSDWLINDVEEAIDKNAKNVNLFKHSTFKNITNIFTKVIIALITGYYILEEAQDPNWMNVLWKAFQVGLFIVMGFMRFFGDYNFVTHKYRNQIIRKKNIFIAFRNSLIQQPDMYILKDDLNVSVLDNSNKESEEK